MQLMLGPIQNGRGILKQDSNGKDCLWGAGWIGYRTGSFWLEERIIIRGNWLTPGTFRCDSSNAIAKLPALRSQRLAQQPAHRGSAKAPGSRPLYQRSRRRAGLQASLPLLPRIQAPDRPQAQ